MSEKLNKSSVDNQVEVRSNPTNLESLLEYRIAIGGTSFVFATAGLNKLNEVVNAQENKNHKPAIKEGVVVLRNLNNNVLSELRVKSQNNKTLQNKLDNAQGKMFDGEMSGYIDISDFPPDLLEKQQKIDNTNSEYIKSVANTKELEKETKEVLSQKEYDVTRPPAQNNSNNGFGGLFVGIAGLAIVGTTLAVAANKISREKSQSKNNSGFKQQELNHTNTTTVEEPVYNPIKPIEEYVIKSNLPDSSNIIDDIEKVAELQFELNEKYQRELEEINELSIKIQALKNAVKFDNLPKESTTYKNAISEIESLERTLRQKNNNIQR